jgi:hypothetical protein
MGDYPQMMVPIDHVEPVPRRIPRALARVGALICWPESPTSAPSTSSQSTSSQIRHKPKHLHADGRSRRVSPRTAARGGKGAAPHLREHQRRCPAPRCPFGLRDF